MSSPDAANPARRRRLRRAAASFLLAATMTLPATGCAVVARALTAAEAVSVLHDLASTVQAPRPASGTDVIDGVITGTGGTGLRLNDRPGGHRIAAFPDGATVTIECHVSGPRIAGPAGPTSMWSQVRTADGRRGFMSEAYLRIDHAGSNVPAC